MQSRIFNDRAIYCARSERFIVALRTFLTCAQIRRWVRILFQFGRIGRATAPQRRNSVFMFQPATYAILTSTVKMRLMISTSAVPVVFNRTKNNNETQIKMHSSSISTRVFVCVCVFVCAFFSERRGRGGIHSANLPRLARKKDKWSEESIDGCPNKQWATASILTSYWSKMLRSNTW